jgi:hypothetical protein
MPLREQRQQHLKEQLTNEMMWVVLAPSVQMLAKQLVEVATVPMMAELTLQEPEGLEVVGAQLLEALMHSMVLVAVATTQQYCQKVVLTKEVVLAAEVPVARVLPWQFQHWPKRLQDRLLQPPVAELLAQGSLQLH